MRMNEDMELCSLSLENLVMRGTQLRHRVPSHLFCQFFKISCYILRSSFRLGGFEFGIIICEPAVPSFSKYTNAATKKHIYQRSYKKHF
jgi:hypothetical protein